METLSATETFLAILPALIFAILYGIPIYLLARSKGYASIIWVIFSFVPILNFLTIVFIIGLPDKIFRNSLLVLLELKKKKEAKLNLIEE